MNAKFPTHWKLLQLENVVDALIDYRGKTPAKKNSGIPLITAKIVKDGRLLEPTEFIAEEQYETWMVRGFPRVGDVIVTTEAPLGEVAQLTNAKIALAQRIVTLRGKSGVLLNDYFFCILQSEFVQNQLKARASGSTVKGIKQSELRKIILPIPPIQEQILIAHHIKILRDKIETNRLINQTLEKIAQAIFKSWFVDFDPTRAKVAAKEEWENTCGNKTKSDQVKASFIEHAAMRVISGKSDSELEQLDSKSLKQLKLTASFFPNSLVDSELGEVPAGWDIKKVDEIVELSYGKSLNKNERIDGNIPVYGSGGLTGLHNTALVEGPGIIIGRKGTVGTIYWEDNSFYPIDTVFYVSCRAPATLTYVFYLLQTLHLETMNTDGAVPGLNRNNVYRLEVVKPNSELIKIFSETAMSIRENIFSYKKEITLLEDLRNLLLPKLLAGELHAPEVEI